MTAKNDGVNDGDDYDAAWDGEVPDFVVEKPTTKCEHELKYLHPGTGKYDVYQCVKCKEYVSKPWNEVGGLSYKDRV